MKSRICACSILVLIVSTTTLAQAGEIPRFSPDGRTIHGGSVEAAKAGADTINLMASRRDPTNGPGEPSYIGDFEDENGNPNWNGWTHWDVSQPTTTHWKVSNYNQPDPGNHAAWCGDLGFAACDTLDSAGGYGNSWHDLIEFRTTVPDPGLGSTVTVTATLTHDTEPSYDFTYLSFQYEGQAMANLQAWDGAGTVAVSEAVSFQPSEYLDGTDIAVFFRFKSDGGWSDEDCQFASAGGCQVDDINVHLLNGSSSENHFEDFEHGGSPDDFGIWTVAYPPGVGDFAKIWSGLGDMDPCVTNTTPQVAFIDDGIVVPGTGGSQCLSWCYGPGGYIVNTTGGLAGPEEHLWVAVESPVMDWPAPAGGTGPDYDGITVGIDIYRHEDLSANAPGMFYTWKVRSADTDNSAGNGFQDILEQGWHRREFVYYGGPGYVRGGGDVSDLVNPGRDQVQIQLVCYELGWVWYWNGNDGYPAPYFDNVTVKIFPFAGPGMAARDLDLAQDNFPDRGSYDFGDLGSHSVRFDMACNISPAAHLRNDPGDSIVVDISSTRSGADLDGDPLLHYTLDRNPVFDPYRGPRPATGSVVGLPAVGGGGSPTPGRWAFDFPDTGFLFPGDVLHYYIEATDAIGGEGGTDPRTATLPADLTGYGVFDTPMGYNTTFVVHALPTIKADGSQPGILFINDFANRGGEDKWYAALTGLGLQVGEDYDVYHVNGPASGVGNGIGGRGSDILIEGYEDILYTCGDLGFNTIANGDFNIDPGDDVGTLRAWLDAGDHDMFLTGDDLASDLAQAGPVTLDFMENYLGVEFVSNEVRTLVGNQIAPLVAASGSNPVFNGSLQAWYAYGACPGLNTFDAVEVQPGAMRIAEFTGPGGLPASYPFSAATLDSSVGLAGTSRVISLPYDLMFVQTDPTAPGSVLAGRTRLLRDVLAYFNVDAFGTPVSGVDVPGIVFQAGNYPNPFNPSTTIRYSLPRAGHLSLKIYNVRGQLIKTLIDGPRPAGADQSAVWDGTDNQGSAAASGMYFLEARAMGDVRIAKMTLLK